MTADDEMVPVATGVRATRRYETQGVSMRSVALKAAASHIRVLSLTECAATAYGKSGGWFRHFATDSDARSVRFMPTNEPLCILICFETGNIAMREMPALKGEYV